MFEFLNPKITSFGIDLSDLSVKIIDLKKIGGNFVLSAFNREEIKKGVIEEGEIKKEDELIEVIKKAVKDIKGHPLKTKYCVVSLPETESYLRMVKLPQMQQKEAAEAVKWELEAAIPHKIEDIYYDWQIVSPLDPVAKHLDVLVGVLPKITVDPYLNALKKAGLKPIIFEIESIATARALIPEGRSEEPIVILDIGAKRTSLLIYSGSTIYFTTSIPVSNTSLIKILSEKLEITEKKAKEIKFKVGLDFDHPKSGVFEALKPSLNEMIEKIKISIDFYNDHYLASQTKLSQLSRIKEVLLCGGGARMEGLAEYLSSQLGLSVKVGSPWVNISSNPSQVVGALPFEDAPAYATAIGLALREFSE